MPALLAESIDGAWVDTSGKEVPRSKNPRNDFAYQPNGKTINIATQTWRTHDETIWYLRCCKWPFWIYIKMRDIFSNWVRYTISGDGQEPGPPINVKTKFPIADSGTAAGDISLISNGDSHLKGFPLLVAIGGTGQDGYPGANSPMCNGNSYAAVHTGITRNGNWNHAHVVHHLPNGPGGHGGASGDGGKISLTKTNEGPFVNLYQKNFMYSSGIPGLGGKAGLCKPQGKKYHKLDGKLGKYGKTQVPVIQ